MNKTKILIYDLETSPSLGYVWGAYEQNVIEFERDWYILCFTARWLDGKTITYSLPDFKLYKNDPENDKELVKKLWGLFEEANIIIAHNGDSFDNKKSNARFIQHGLPPPSSYKSVDTRKIARKYFKFDSNSLDNLARYLNLGRKGETGGFKTWKGCMTGDKAAWRKMIAYNIQDVKLLEKVYLKLRPWIRNHPNRALLEGKSVACPNCGSEKLQKRGYEHTRTTSYQRFQCQSCTAWSSSRISEENLLLTR